VQMMVVAPETLDVPAGLGAASAAEAISA